MDMGIDLELEMKISHRKLQFILIHEFRLARRATEETSNMCGTMEKDALSLHIAQHWFYRFKNGNYNLDDLPHTGRSLQLNMGLLKQLIEKGPKLTRQRSGEQFGCSDIAVEAHLHELGKTWKYRV